MPNRTPHMPGSFQAAKKAMLDQQAKEQATRLHRSRAAAIALEHPDVSRLMRKTTEANQKLILDALETFADKTDVNKPLKAVLAFSLRDVKVPGIRNLLWRALEDGDRMASADVEELVSA